jgi:four helix bundle protein
MFLRIHDTIIELIRDLVPVIASIAHQDSDLGSQLRRAISSAALNVAEGSGQRGKRRENHYAIALGSAREAWSCLCVADAFGYVHAAPKFKTRFDHVIGTLCVVSRR